jgi:outer membrane protein OmpU
MKKVLLTTTALAMTAGVASAEITFSGSGEAGVYRTAPTAATTGTAGIHAGTTGAATGYDVIAYGTDGYLAQTAATATAGNDGVMTGAEVAALLNTVVMEQQDLAAAEAALAADGGTTDTAWERANLADDVAKAQADLALAQAIYDAAAGVAATGKGATPKLKAYSGYDFNVAASGASDNGMTFAMGFDMGAGSIADQDDDRAMDAQGGAVDTSGLTIGYAGYTVVIGDEKVDDLYDADGWNADVSISGSLGDLTFTLATDMDDDVKAVAATTAYYKSEGASVADSTNATTGAVEDGGVAHTAAVFTAASAGTAAEYNPTSYAIGYSMGNVAFSMAGTEHDAFGNSAAKMSLTYTVSDALSATYSVDNVGTYKDIAKLAATYSLSDMISITASVKDDKDHALNTNTSKKQSTDVSIAYAAGAMAATLATDESSNWWVNAKYDLGGGATAFTTFDHSEFLVAGVNFAF